MAPFEDAVRAYFKMPPEAQVGCETTGGREVQIGDCTWDTEGITFTLWANHNQEHKTEDFDDLPTLLNTLMEVSP